MTATLSRSRPPGAMITASRHVDRSQAGIAITITTAFKNLDFLGTARRRADYAEFEMRSNSVTSLEVGPMKIVGLEEQLVTDDAIDAWRRLDRDVQDIAFKASSEGEMARRLRDLGEGRLGAMAGGLDVQVLSLTAPGSQNLSPDDAVALQPDLLAS